MKALRNSIIVISIALLVLVSGIGITEVNAAATPEVLTIEANFDGDKLTVSGTTDPGVYAVEIMVYDKDGNNLITMKSTEVTGDNKYKDVLDVKSGDYVVRAARYEGGTVVEAKVVTPKKTDTNTGDANNMTLLIALLTIAAVGTGAMLVIKKRNN